MIEQQCPQFLKRKRNDKQCHLATTKSLRWLGGRVFRPLRVSGRTTGLGGEDCFGTLTVWELLWYLKRSAGFWRTDSRFGDGETFGQVSLFRHVDGLRVALSACWLLTVSEVSSISPEDPSFHPRSWLHMISHPIAALHEPWTIYQTCL